VHKKVDPSRQLDRLEAMGPVPAHRIINIDATHHSTDKTQPRGARSPASQRAFRYDWDINGKRYTIFALYSIDGYWKIYYENCSHTHCIDFLESCKDLINDDCVIFANASIHTHEAALLKVEEVAKISFFPLTRQLSLLLSFLLLERVISVI